MRYPIPENEERRLAFLRDLNVFKGTLCTEIQSLCVLAADVAGSEIALVSLIEAEEQVFAANMGLEGVNGTPRDQAFCAHAIMDSGQMIVPDAEADPRFANNPLVTGGPGIRAYAGTVLEPSPDMRVGTLCVIDRTPRDYSPAVRENLARIGAAISALLLAHRDKLRLMQAMEDLMHREDALRLASETDPMSGLANSAAFRSRLTERLCHARRPAALFLMDVDRFKLVNDRYGHPFGDSYIRRLADALLDAVPPDAIVGRMGGDEFGVFVNLPTASIDEVFDTFRQFRLSIDAAVAPLDKPDLGQVSFGASTFPDHAETFETLYQNADIALYASKDAGRNTFTVFDDDLGAQFGLRTRRESVAQDFPGVRRIGGEGQEQDSAGADAQVC